MMEKYGTPMATRMTRAIHSHAAIFPPGDSWVCAGREPLPLTRRKLFLLVMQFCSSHMAMQIHTKTEERLAERPKSMGAVVE